MNRTKDWIANVARRYERGLFLVMALLISLPVLFYNSIHFNLPIGSAGLFAEMAHQVLVSDFSLPLNVPFYGPGSIPFAYPPLGFYLMALFLKIGIHPYTYLRWMPPIFSLIALIPFYKLTERVSGSFFSASVVMIVLASSPELFALHSTAGGVIRALAYIFMLFAMEYYVRTINEWSLADSIVAGIFFGLSFLTHLYYGLVFLVWAVVWLLVKINFQKVRGALITGVAALLVATPWLIVTLARHGLKIFNSVIESHGNTTFLSASLSLTFLSDWLAENLSVLTTEPLFLIWIIIGMVFLITERNYELPLFFLIAIWMFSEGGRFVVTISSILAAVGMARIKQKFVINKGYQFIIYLLFIISSMTSVIHGIQRNRLLSPWLHESTATLGTMVQNHTPVVYRYLFVGYPTEAEWLPYILQRTPLVSAWGSEWVGGYSEKIGMVRDAMSCESRQDFSCVKQLMTRSGSSEPEMIITRKGDKELTAQIISDPEWALEWEIGRYLVWMK